MKRSVKIGGIQRLPFTNICSEKAANGAFGVILLALRERTTRGAHGPTVSHAPENLKDVTMENIALAEPGAHLSVWALFMQAGWVVKLVMIGLLCASIWTWAIIVDKLVAYGRMRLALNRFEQVFWSGQSLEELYRTLADRKTSGMGAIFVAAMREWKKSFEKGAKSPLGLQTRIDKAMDLALTREMERLEGRLGFLATTGSAAPFIGLFGTVIGIMTSFQAIAASKNTSLSVVAPGIAEALLATAIGLLAAIPAVIAYNKLSSDANKIAMRMEGFADEFSAILSRQIDEKVAPKA
jgi:biopolymer transport protein TolQ